MDLNRFSKGMIDHGRAPILLLALCACSQATNPGEAQEGALGPDFFTTEVLPILEERCYDCHGPEAKRPKGGLRILGRDSLLRGGSSGPSVNTDHPGESLMLSAIRYEDPDLEMPPDEPLPPAERAVLERWIAAGIPWSEPEQTPEEIESAHFFEQSIRPLLAEHCFECHGPERSEPKGGLRMTGRDALLAGGLSGTAITPGDPDASRLIHAVRYTDSLLKMPPRDRLTPGEVSLLEEWVRRGVPWPGGAAAEVHTGGVDIAAGREWWAFRPVERPDVADGHERLGSIDALLLERMTAAEVTPNPLASDAELVRRVYQDLTGLPPSPEAVAAYVADDSPDKWSKLVDELLESKRYGVRYARHWLDVVRYAQTNGYERDREKPYAWKYRDWVVHALNLDMPYDEFLRQQLAGDELEGANRESVAATGFLRLGPWDSEPDDRDQADFDQYDDMVRAISEGFLGVTIGCARCHDHKFDPIRQTDYYGLMAFVRNILPYRKPTFSLESRSFAIHDFNEEVRRSWEGGKSARRLELEEERVAFLSQERRQWILELIPTQPEDVQDAFWTPGDDRTPEQITLLSKNSHLAPTTEEVEASLEGDKRLRFALLKQDAQRLKNSFEGDLDWILCAKESGTEVEPTHLLARGRVHSPRDVVAPGFPPAMCVDDASSEAAAATPRAPNSSTGLRTVLADWITDPAHPTTARVIANRVWLWHFGEGIVPTPNDFGRAGMPPSDPELLDWLAAELIENGWSLKHLHRVILSSEAYRRSSRDAEGNAETDPKNRLFWRQNLRRLDAESARDAMLAVSGALSLKMGGRGFFPKLSKGALGGASRPGEGWGASTEEERSRRAIYAYSKRNMRVPFLEVLDQANPEQSVGMRASTTVPTQTLTLTNSSFVNQQAAKLAERTLQEAGEGDADVIRHMFQLTLQRAPSEEELEFALTLLKDQRGAHPHEIDFRHIFASRVPDRLQTSYLDEIDAEAMLHGPSGWQRLKGAWESEYNDTLETQRHRGPIALHPESSFRDAELYCELTLSARGDRASILLRGSPAGSDYRGLSIVFDSGNGEVSIVHHRHPDLPSEVLAKREAALNPRETCRVNILIAEGEYPNEGGVMEEVELIKVNYWQGSSGDGELLTTSIPKTRGERFGLAGWGERVVFDHVELSAARHPKTGPDDSHFPEESHDLREDTVAIIHTHRDFNLDAVTSLALVLLNTNEFLYVE